MGTETKRKTRRGKRGGDTKRQQDDAETVNEQGSATSEPTVASSSAYVAPPMDSAAAPFYIDTQAATDSAEAQAEKISPASYGLVNPDLQKYLKSCEDMLDDQKFGSTEDRDIFINNVYSEMKNFELQLTTDHEASRILEKLFWISNDYQIKRYFAVTREDTIRLVVHRFSSHTIQTLLLLSAIALEREMRGEICDFADTGDDDETSGPQAVRTALPTFEELVLGLAKTLAPQWSYLMANEYASHILRVLLLVLTGSPIEDQANPKTSIKSKRSVKYMEDRNGTPAHHRSLASKRAVPSSFGPALTELLKTVSDDMSDLAARGFTSTTVGGTVLQSMLELQAERSSIEYPGSLLDKCLMGLVSAKDISDANNARRDAYIKMMIEDVAGSHFLQMVMNICSSELLQKLYDLYFRGNLKALAFHPISNFVVQSLFSNAKSERQLKSMIEGVAPMVGDLLFKNRPGVVRALVDSCVRLESGYLELINALYNGLGAKSAAERGELINLLAFLITYAEFANSDYNRLQFKIQGSLIIQAILQFPSDGLEPMMDSYFSQDPEKIFSWCKDPSGSRIIEAILKSKQVPANSKRRVLEQHLGRYAELAMDRYGSHIVDACWETADIQFKEKILRELVKRETQLQDNQFGRFMLRNCRVEQYKRKSSEWRERERGLEKKKLMFKDFLGTAKPSGVAVQPVAGPKTPQHTTFGSKPKASDVDEIDSLFQKSNVRVAANDQADKITKATSEKVAKVDKHDGKAADKSLEAVMDAISGAKRKKSKSKDKSQDEDKDQSSAKKSKKAKEEERKKRRAFAG
ncbi:Nucleolar protein 9 [Coemansia sp. S155-1]|nr:Nucleolar protein 9 [Coemansia sp. S680]KAJ2062325.1 Nucleolar protein 9 [Coemansia sp. S155-1]